MECCNAILLYVFSPSNLSKPVLSPWHCSGCATQVPRLRACLEGRNFVLIGTVQLLQEPAKKRIQMGPEARSIVNQHVEFITYSLISTGMITERQCMSFPCCQLTERPIKIRCILIAFHQIILKQNNYRKLNNQLIGLSTKYGVSSGDGYINLFRLK